jgi:single-strand DNA-binding protein
MTKLAEVCNQHLSKGKQVCIEGRLHSRTYQTKDGQTRSSLDVTLSDVHFLAGQGADGHRAAEEVADTVSLDDLLI